MCFCLCIAAVSLPQPVPSASFLKSVNVSPCTLSVCLSLRLSLNASVYVSLPDPPGIVLDRFLQWSLSFIEYFACCSDLNHPLPAIFRSRNNNNTSHANCQLLSTGIRVWRGGLRVWVDPTLGTLANWCKNSNSKRHKLYQPRFAIMLVKLMIMITKIRIIIFV